MSEEKKPGYLIQFNKQTSQLGEVVSISTNLPEGATQEELGMELTKIGRALDARMRALNEDVKKRTGKNLSDLGLDPSMAGIDPASVYETGETK
jgi:hypothetical protein